MARFSLSPPAKPQAQTAATAAQPIEFQWKFPPRDYHAESLEETEDDSPSCSSSSSVESSLSDSSEEEEPPHPLGFDCGRTHFGLSPSRVVVRAEDAWNAPVRISPARVSPPRGLDHRGVSASTLLRGITPKRSADMDGIEHLLRAASIRDTPALPQPSFGRMAPDSKLMQLARAAEREQYTISAQMSRLEREQVASHQTAVNALLSLIQADQDTYNDARKRMDERQRQQQKEEEHRRHLLQLQAEEEQRQYQQEQKEKEEKLKQAQQEKEAHQQKLRQREEQSKREREAANRVEKQRTAHILRAKELVSNLIHTIRPKLSEFDRCKSVSKRRLGFKKIVNGKINTLSHDENKVKEVARSVVDSILSASKDDDDEAASNENKEDVIPSKMGKQYLLDLLAGNLIVRVQADGFNGTRGDGFPLGACFALISNECDDDNLHTMLEGHLYRVCPTAVPVLELEYDDGLDGGEEEEKWMERLGMIREKSGEFESFDKFLHRTEGLISVMANIMSSLPSDHTLLGGHQGALTWLERFLDLVPAPPTKPLPLLTAPVLVAFLTGAGHMLANKFDSQFRPLFASIEKDILDRLDDSPVGVPSATRLKKVMEGGFDGIKQNMPAGAIESLYDGKEGSGNASTTLPPASAPSAKSNPFGQSATSSASPFGVAPPSNSTPFGPAATPASASPFAQTSNNSGFGNASPFSSNNPTGGGENNFSTFGQPAATNQSPFGAAPSTSSSPFGQPPPTNPSPFGAAPSSSSPFGQPPPTNPSPFGAAPSTSSSPFGQPPPTNPSPFGAAPSTSSSPFDTAPSTGSSPFGQANAPVSSGFGGTPTPFGASQTNNTFGSSAAARAPAPSPFGSSSSQNMNPFGGTPASSFGSSNSSNVKKDTRAPCKFFAKGNCRYGANCKFSHGDGASTGNTSSFSSFGASFGASNPSPFGGSSGFGNPSPFSSNVPSNPFGGPRR